MSGEYLLDTNIIIGYTKNARPLVDFINQRRRAVFYASVITRMELLSFPGLNQDDAIIINRFLADLNIISLNEQIERAAIDIRKTRMLKLPDAIVAATSWIMGAALITLDRRLANTEWPGLHIIIPT